MPLNEYTTGNVIGKGTYGEVSLVKHKKDRKQYVIKRVDIHNASQREQKAAELEAKLLSQVRHPNIVSYKESFQGNDGFLYIVMAFCEGGDMYTRLKAQKGNHLEERQIVEWFVQIAMALQYLHDRHILHRDLKTQNIFLTKSKIIKVGDLGIARVLENASDMATTMIGTPYYMSPELFSNKPYSYKSDVWALGCCLYEMCTLKHAFNAKDMNSLVYKILKGKLPAMPKVYSNDLCDIIKSMLAQEPEKRPSVARLLRHSFIKKQIALFLEGTKSRQRKSSKTKESQKSASASVVKSDKTDSGYGEMDSRENPVALEPVDPGNRESRLRDGDQEVDSKPTAQLEQDSESRKVKSPIPKREQLNGGNKVGGNVEKTRQSKETSSSQARPRSQEKRKAGRRISETEDDTKSDSTADRQKSSRSRPLPPKPPSRPVIDPSLNPDVKVSRERRRLKVSKQVDDKGSVVQSSNDSNYSSQHEELKPKVSSGTPGTARERRRQRERESMVKKSALPSSISSSNPERVHGPRVSNEGSVGIVSSQSSSINEDFADGPPRRTNYSLKEEKSSNGGDNVDVIEDVSSEGSDLEPSSQEEAIEKRNYKQRRKVSNDVNSLISALDTTLKLSDERKSPDMDSEPVEEALDVPVGDISVSSERLRNRIDFLRRDCIEGLGEADFQRACSIIDSQSEENVEIALVQLMGRDNFEKYGGKIWQLKFCETFKRN